MGVGEAVIVAGIGCRKGASAAQVDAAIDTALERSGRPLARIDLMATSVAQERGGGDRGRRSRARRLRLVYVAHTVSRLPAPGAQPGRRA